MYFPSLLLQTTLSFCRMPSLSFSHKCQFSVRSVHAATWSLLNRLCKSFHNCLVLELKHFKQKLPEESHVLPLLSKALAQFKKKKNLLGITIEPAKYPKYHYYQRIYSYHWNWIYSYHWMSNCHVQHKHLVNLLQLLRPQQDHRYCFTPAHFHAVQLGCYIAPILQVQTNKKNIQP